MDLGAFLRPGEVCPVTMTVESGAGSLEGRLLTRRGRPVWLVSEFLRPGERLTLSFFLIGYRLDAEGVLVPGEPQARAEIQLLAQVRACRHYPPQGLYILRLNLLGRIWPPG